MRVTTFGLLALVLGCGGTEGAPTATSNFDSDDPRARAEDVLVGEAYFPNVVVGGTLPAIVDFRPQAPPDWESSNPAVAAVSRTGMITGVSVGTAVIRGSITPGSLTLTSAEGSTDVFPPFVDVALGSIYSCGLTAANALYCWGANGTAQLGQPTSPDVCQAPCAATPHASFSSPVFVQVSLGYGMNCGLTSLGEAYCWGNNQLGQMGSPLGNLAVPVRVPGSISFTTLAVGRSYACGLDATGRAYCWGVQFPSFGNLGAPAVDLCGGLPCNLMPTPVTGGHTFSSLSVGQLHACGLTASGTAYCWGANGSGALGNGGAAAIGSGEQVPQLVQRGIVFAQISAGEVTTCGVSVAGAAYCWGDNSEGQLGNGVITGTPTPVPSPVAVVGNLTFASVHSGGAHACGLSTSGRAYCWGRDFHGQLGDGRTTTVGSPVAVTGNRTFAQLKVRRGHSCGRTAAGYVYCWGQNFYGQLGIGKVEPGAFASVPTGVGGAP